jgi:hypothetical protein
MHRDKVVLRGEFKLPTRGFSVRVEILKYNEWLRRSLSDLACLA